MGRDLVTDFAPGDVIRMAGFVRMPIVAATSSGELTLLEFEFDVDGVNGPE